MLESVRPNYDGMEVTGHFTSGCSLQVLSPGNTPRDQRTRLSRRRRGTAPHSRSRCVASSRSCAAAERGALIIVLGRGRQIRNFCQHGCRPLVPPTTRPSCCRRCCSLQSRTSAPRSRGRPWRSHAVAKQLNCCLSSRLSPVFHFAPSANG